MRKHGSISSWVLPFIALLLFGYLLASLFQNHAAISSKQQELSELEARLEAQETVNQELSRSLNDDTQDIIERIAREQGYAEPNERIFIGY